MRIVEVHVETLDVPLREALVSGRHRWQHRHLALLELRTDEGRRGLGEFAAPEPGGPAAPLIPELMSELQGVHLADPVALEGALRRIDRIPFVGRVARAAVESAIVDLMAQLEELPIAGWLAETSTSATVPRAEVPVNALVGIVPADRAALLAREHVEAGYGCLKLKAGGEPIGMLIERIEAVRAAVGPSVALRVDFNGSLDPGSAEVVLQQLAAASIEYVEQPIPPTAGVAALARLRRRSGIPVAADESVRDAGSARALLRAEAVDVLVVKPARVGGLRQAASIVELAAAAGVPVTISTLLESGVGIAGALHLAAVVPGQRWHGLATADMLASHLLLEPLRIRDGGMSVPRGAGLGVRLDPSAVARFRVAGRVS